MSEMLMCCPLCGAPFKMGREPDDNGYVAGMFYLFHANGPRGCRLGMGGHFDTEAQALAAWNTRSEGLHPPVGEVEEEVFSSLGASRAPSSASAGVAEMPSGGWQLMETAPRDGTSILIDDRHQGVVIGWWETGREFSGSAHFNDWCSGHNTASGYDAGFERIHQPLGWVPLPARQTSGGEA